MVTKLPFKSGARVNISQTDILWPIISTPDFKDDTDTIPLKNIESPQNFSWDICLNKGN
jgi:hypothetical protein